MSSDPALWRVATILHNGNQQAPMDYTRRADAVDHIRSAERIGCTATAHQWDTFTGTWTDWEPNR